MNSLLEYLAKFFGHINVTGLEAMAIKGIQALIVLATAYCTSRILQRIIVRSIRSDDRKDEDARRTYKRIAHGIIMVAGFLLALHIMGLNLSSLFHTGGLLAIAAAFAMKSIAENFISGIILRVGRTVKAGDILETQGKMIRIKAIGLRGTIARTKDSKDILIPNSELIHNWIANYTYKNSDCQVWTIIGVSYSSDLKNVREVLERVCADLDGTSSQHPPRILLSNFGASAVNYTVSVWIKDPWVSGQMKSKLNEAIWWALKDASIEIAFPQLDVHFDQAASHRPAGIIQHEGNDNA